MEPRLELKLSLWKQINIVSKVVLMKLITVHLEYVLRFLLKLKRKPIIIHNVALREDIVLLLLFILDDLQQRILVAHILYPQLLRNAHILVGLDYPPADLKRNGRIVVNQILLHDLQDAVLAHIAVVLSHLLVVQ